MSDNVNMKLALSLFVLLLMIASFAGGYYALTMTTPEAQSEPTIVSEPAPAVEPFRKSSEPRNVWKEPKRKQPEFDAPQPRPISAAPEIPVNSTEMADLATKVSVSTCQGNPIALNASEVRMLGLHNEARAARGLGRLCLSLPLTQAARLYSQDMIARDFYGHYSPENETVTNRVKRLNYPSRFRPYTIGENLDAGAGFYGTPDESFRQLMDSPGHKANILKPAYTEVGVGADIGELQGNENIVVYTIVYGGYTD